MPTRKATAAKASAPKPKTVFELANELRAKIDDEMLDEGLYPTPVRSHLLNISGDVSALNDAVRTEEALVR